jgi:hypothetical protein
LEQNFHDQQRVNAGNEMENPQTVKIKW